MDSCYLRFMRYGLLIILFLDGANPAISQVDFTTEAACERAKTALAKEFSAKKIDLGAVVLSCIDRGPAI